jgi:hypothetical protein
LLASPLLWAKKSSGLHVRQDHLNRWKTCKGCHQSKTLMSDSLPRSTKEFQAMSRQKLKGLLKKATQPLESTCYNSDSHSGRISDRAGTKNNVLVHIICHSLALACKRYRTLGHTCLKPKDLENMRVNGLISLVVNTTLGITP